MYKNEATLMSVRDLTLLEQEHRDRLAHTDVFFFTHTCSCTSRLQLQSWMCTHVRGKNRTHQHDKTPVQNASVIFETACRAQHRLLQPVTTVRTEVKQSI